MNPLLPFLMSKLAAEGSAPLVTKSELKTIKREIEQNKPKSEAEKKLNELVGRSPTKGQLLRAAAVASGGGVATQVLGRVISGPGSHMGKPMYPWIGEKGKWVAEAGKKRWLPSDMRTGKAVLSPRQLARSIALSAVLTAAVPVAKRMWDIKAAKKGKF